MTGFLVPIAVIAVQLLVLYLLSSHASALLHRALGTRLYLLASFPGVVVHELSHLVACIVTRTKVTGVKLFEPSREGGTLVLGYVEHQRKLNPFVAFLVGAAPFFGGSGVLWLLTAFVAPDASTHVVSVVGGAGEAWNAYVSYFGALISAFDVTDWRSWLTAYVILSVSAHLAPSKTDLKHAAFGAAGIAVIVAAAVMLGRWLGFNGVPDAAGRLGTVGATAVSAMLMLGIALSGAWAALILSLTWLLRTGFRNRRPPKPAAGGERGSP